MSANAPIYADRADDVAAWLAILSEDQVLDLFKKWFEAEEQILKKLYPDMNEGQLTMHAKHSFFAYGSHLKNCPCVSFKAIQGFTAMVEGALIGTGK